MKKFKKLFAVLMVLSMVLSLVPAMASAEGELEPGAIQVGFVDRAQFHCNEDGGQAKVYVSVNGSAPMKTYTGALVFEYLGFVDNVGGYCWKIIGAGSDPNDYEEIEIICDVHPSGKPGCGKSDWTSFSNFSGVPDGKNVQFIHVGSTEPPPLALEVIKYVDDELAEGYEGVFTFQLENTDTGDIEEASIDAYGVAEFDLARDSYYKITELAVPEGFIDVTGSYEFDTFGEIDSPIQVTWDNKTETTQYEGFSILKTVDGVAWELWANGYEDEDLLAILEGISFELYAVAEDGAMIDYDSESFPGSLDTDGYISFPNNEYADGWYAIVEILSDRAAEVFAEVDPLYIHIVDNKVVDDEDAFDLNAFYTIVNGYGGGYQLGYPGLNNSGDIFPISVRNRDTGETYPSFCANGGSRAFAGESGLGCSGYVVATNFEGTNLGAENAHDYDDFVSAYNYIYDNYGDLNDNRAITQIVTWYLLGSLDIPSAGFDGINWAAIETGTSAVAAVADAKTTVEDVIAHYKNYKGNGNIVALVLMVCENHHDAKDCQPQLVPVYGGIAFNNTEFNTPLWAVNLNKTVDGATISEWIDVENLDDEELLEWIAWFEAGNVTFNVYKVDAEGDPIEGLDPENDIPILLDTTGQIFLGDYEDGWYALEEVLSVDAAKIFEAKELVYFEVDGGKVDIDVDNTEIFGSIKVSASIGTWFSMKDSLTGGYSEESGKARNAADVHSVFNGTKENGNSWFQYNEFSNGTGGDFDIVNGDKLTKVGEYTIEALGDGLFQITIAENFKVFGAQVSISNDFATGKNQKEANAAAIKLGYKDITEKDAKGKDVVLTPASSQVIWTSAPGQQAFSLGDGKSFTFYAPWVDLDETVYIYMHLSGIEGYLDAQGIEVGDTYEISLFDAAGIEVADSPKTLVMVGGATINGSVVFDNLKPGDYTVFVNGEELGTYTVFDEEVPVTFDPTAY